MSWWWHLNTCITNILVRHQYDSFYMSAMMMHENIFERLPRPDEVIKYEQSFRNGTKIQQEKQTTAYGCQSFIKCPEWLTF